MHIIRTYLLCFIAIFLSIFIKVYSDETLNNALEESDQLEVTTSYVDRKLKDNDEEIFETASSTENMKSKEGDNTLVDEITIADVKNNLDKNNENSSSFTLVDLMDEKSLESTTLLTETEVYTSTIVPPVDSTIQDNYLLTTSTKSEPFYHKTVQHIVNVVKSDILNEPSIEFEATTVSDPYKDNNETDPRLDRLSDQIRAIINHYQKYGEVTIPSTEIPDPMNITDVKKNFGVSPTSFTDMKLYGLSNFTITHINTDLNKMQVYVLVLMKRLVIFGNYSTKSWLARSSGPFKIILYDVETEGAAELKKNENGTLEASESELDMTFKTADVDFKNVGVMGSLLQNVLATAAPALFNSIKPSVLEELNKSIRKDLNSKLSSIGNRIALSGSRPPLDAAEEEGRNYIKENGYDPYHIKNVSVRQNVFTVNITEFVLNGLSNFRRVGEAVLSMDEGTIQIGSHVAALNLTGKCKWSVGVGRNFKKHGFTNFTVDHIQVRAFVNQSLDVSNKPKLDKLDINLGKVRVKMAGAGRFDFFVEAMVNTLPNIIRHIIVDAVEEPLKYKIQKILNKIEPEVVLEKSLPELDNLGL